MPREKQGKRKTKGAPQSIVSTLQKFLKTYEKRCVQTQTSVCPAIKRDLKASINHERILRKVCVSSQETKEHGSSIPSSPELVGLPALRSCLHAVQSLTLAPVCSALLLPSHSSLPVCPSLSFILRAALPVLTPLHLWNGQPALPPTLCLESPAQKHPFCHHCRTSLASTPDPPKECLLVLTSDASKPSG